MDLINLTREELLKELQELQGKYDLLKESLAANVSEREYSEYLLYKSEDLFRKAFYGSPSPMTIARCTDGAYIAVNDSFLHLVELTREEVIGKTGEELNLIETESRNKLLQEIKEKGSIHNVEIQANSKSGKKLYLLTSVENTELAGEKCTIATMQDITERKQTELLLQIKNEDFETQNKEYLQLNEELTQTNYELNIAKEKAEEGGETFRMLFESINDAVFISEVSEDKIAKIVEVNDVACKRLGYTHEELITKTPFDLNSDKTKALAFDFVKELLNNKHLIAELEHVTKDGRIIPVEISSRLTHFKDRTIIHTIARDLTERNRVALKIRQSEDKYRKVFQTAPDAITINRLSDGMYTSVNNGFTKIFGYNEEEVIGKTSREINIWNIYEERTDFIHLVQTNGFIENFEAKFNTKNGKIIDALVFSSVIELEGMPHILTITRDITQKKHNEDALKKSTAIFNAALKSMTDAVFISNLEGEIIEFNDAFATFHRFQSKEECLNRLDDYPDILEVYQSNGEQVALDMWAVSRALRGEQVMNEEYSLRRKDIGETWVGSYSFGPIRNDKGEITGSVVVGRDVTERKKAELLLQEKAKEIEVQNEEYQQLNEELIQTNEELIEAKERAEQSDRLKTAFLQNMSHEIRTPMNAIMGFAELLIEEFDDKEKLAEFSQIINQRCSDLLDIINEILDVAKIESGQLPVNLEECKIDALFSEISLFFKEFQKRQDKQHLNFTVNLSYNMSDSVILVDKVKLKQILINLISNAFKFTEKGEIKIGCKVDDNKRLIFYVSDTGIGIPVDKQNFIFERFTQIESGHDRKYGGTGLGLSIAKGLVHLLGGEIWVDSELHKGSTFYFTFSYKLINHITEYQEVKKHKQFDFSGKRILIVEDDIYNAEYLKEVLKCTGIEIIHSYYGNEAIQISESQKLDIVLMDIRLPDINGYEATQAIRKNKPNLKIIAQTAYAAEEDRETAIKAGCNDYISKPIRKDTLYSLIDKCLLEA